VSPQEESEEELEDELDAESEDDGLEFELDRSRELDPFPPPEL
jgi:hypothetical protein